MILPSNSIKLNWDMIVTIVLLYSCISTPAQIALYETLGNSSLTLNLIVDLFFVVDIVIIFNTAIMDENYETVTSYK